MLTAQINCEATKESDDVHDTKEPIELQLEDCNGQLNLKHLRSYIIPVILSAQKGNAQVEKTKDHIQS